MADTNVRITLPKAPYAELVEDEVVGSTVFSADKFSVEAVNIFTGTAGVDLGTVLADSGDQATPGKYEFFILIHSPAAVDIDIEHRDTPNTSTRRSYRVVVPVNEVRQVRYRPVLLANENVRLTLQTEIGSGVIVSTAIFGRRLY